MILTVNQLLDTLRIQLPSESAQPGDVIPLSLNPSPLGVLKDMVSGLSLDVNLPNVQLSPDGLTLKPDKEGELRLPELGLMGSLVAQALNLTPTGEGSITLPAQEMGGQLLASGLKLTPDKEATLNLPSLDVTGQMNQVNGKITPTVPTPTFPNLDTSGSMVANGLQATASGPAQLSLPVSNVTGGLAASNLKLTPQGAGALHLPASALAGALELTGVRAQPAGQGGVALPDLNVAGKLVTSLVGTASFKPLAALPTVTFSWFVEDVEGKRVKEDAVFVYDSSLPSPSIVFMPQFTALSTESTVEVVEYRIFCKVTIDAGNGAEPQERVVGPVVVRVPKIPFPAVVALTTSSLPRVDTEEDVSLLVVVPGSSPITGIDALLQVLRRVQVILNRVKAFGSFYAASYTGMTDALDLLNNLLSKVETVSLERRDQISNMCEIVIDPGIFWFLGKSFSKKTSGLLAMGPRGMKIGFFSKTDCNKSDEPWFDVTIGESFFVRIDNLGSLDRFEPSDAQVSYNKKQNQNDLMRSMRFYVNTGPR